MNVKEKEKMESRIVEKILLELDKKEVDSFVIWRLSEALKNIHGINLNGVYGGSCSARLGYGGIRSNEQM